mgnify:CR=1 FL=1
MKPNFRFADKPWYYHVTAAAIRYNITNSQVSVTPEPNADGVKLMMIGDKISLTLYETTEGLLDSNPIVPVNEIKECLTDKLAVFYITEGVIGIYDVAAFNQKKANPYIKKEVLDFDTYNMEVFTLGVTKAFGPKFDMGLRWLKAEDGSPIYAEVSIKEETTKEDLL